MEFKFDFYKITKCGYYKIGSDERELMSVSELFENLIDFTANKTINQTKTYNEMEGIYPTYSYELLHNKMFNDYLFVTWNETHSEDNNISTVKKNSRVGSAEVDTIPISDEDIPGFPTYFWILSDLEYFATIKRVEIRQNGQINLKMYLLNFLKYFSKHCYNETTELKNEKKIYYCDSKSKEILKIFPHFETNLAKKNTDLLLLKSKVSEIRNLIVKDYFSNNFTRPLSKIEYLQKIIGIETTNKFNFERMLKIETGINLNIEELNSIIEDWEPKHLENDKYDIGFKLTKSSSPIWLSNSICNTVRKYPIQKDSNNVIKPNELFDCILKERMKLIELGNFGG